MTERTIGPGTLLAGRFRLEDLLDESEGGKFWRATDRILARNVAVHVVASSNPRAQAVLDAARISATIIDGHLLRVLDADVEDDVVYVVNEWGSGMSLDRILDEGPLSPRRAAWVAKEVAEAICTAHRSGVAHGRLLPENVLITETGAVKLIGFVVDAALRGGHPGDDAAAAAAQQTDVTDLGAVLYAGLTGRWPGSPGSAVPAAPSEDGCALRPRQVRAGVPNALDAICRGVLGSPGHHPPAPSVSTAVEVFAALSDYIGDPAATAYFAGPSEDTPTQATPVGPGPGGTGDAEATQAGTPVFSGESIGGWASPSGGGDAGGTKYADRADDLRPRQDPPPPPPVLPEADPRPLFAAGPAAASRTAPTSDPWPTTGGRTSTGVPPQASSRNGPLPAAWGPDVQPEDTDTGDLSGGYDTGTWGADRPGTSWLKLAAGLAGIVVVVVAAVFAFNQGRDTTEPTPPRGGSNPSGTPASEPIKVAAVADFDPEGDPAEENPDEAPLAVDGDPSTAWSTMTYFNDPQLGGLKSGVGLVVDLGSIQRLSAVKLTLLGTPTSVQIRTAPDLARRPTGNAGLDVVAGARGVGTATTLRLDEPVETRYFVVWLTSLPPTTGGFEGRVAEIVPRS